MAEGGITGKGFRKGDPRINRNGRPKSFDAWRKLTQGILSEVAMQRENPNDPNSPMVPVIIDGHKATVAEMIARGWARDKKLQERLIEAAFGKVPQQINLGNENGGPLTFIITRDDGKEDKTLS